MKRVEISKPDGGVRKLGIPTVLDRFIQQAVMHSYGFHPGRSAHQAVEAAQRYIAEGYRGCVDLDLEKFFDRVSHNKLMAKIAEGVQRQAHAEADRGVSAGWRDGGRAGKSGG